jgi:hypothetical protein
MVMPKLLLGRLMTVAVERLQHSLVEVVLQRFRVSSNYTANFLLFIVFLIMNYDNAEVLVGDGCC